MILSRFVRCCCVASFGLSLCSVAVRAQGSLTPPPGPPGPTMKTLSQVEPRTPIGGLPFTVQTAGSYYLTTNVAGRASAHGIIIEASDVTLDLNGFVLSGVAEAQNGIQIPAVQRNIAIRNGTVQGWSVGVEARQSSECQFEGLRVIDNAAAGLVAGVGSTIAGCNAFGNRGFGLSAGANSSITDVSAQSNQLEGIRADSG